MNTVITPKIVASNVRIWRGHLGIKQHVVAAELGVCRKWYGDLENGRVRFKVDQLLVIAQLFNISPGEFFKEKIDFEKQKIAPPRI
ncbi:helix-turn-helix domain-containing protein [Haliscomenobacter hydrossis]|uniref:Helix-turn-helix domain protein n=1 Tax=Haliscomenobacter hydrossis (strain ATCC 27775 / DSM 1100 / LMG 10767 / O) TaxID=760192 RepID=F4KYT1_HALH1|nr:helix-turn-helix transcriptional regulator [Haliscomenobacter hydrossis]AEE51473.1 helix-turn-helix domain protein [Haliscomenobacter hydrossis DSM 1100]